MQSPKDLREKKMLQIFCFHRCFQNHLWSPSQRQLPARGTDMDISQPSNVGELVSICPIQQPAMCL